MQDYCIAVHSRYIIKPVAPIDVICLLSYSGNELGYQKKEKNKHYMYCFICIIWLEYFYYLLNNKLSQNLVV